MNRRQLFFSKKQKACQFLTGVVIAALASVGLRAIETEVGSKAHPLSVSAGSAHTQTIRSDGSVWGWGMPYHGNLADGETSSHKGAVAEPQQAKGPDGKGTLSGMKDISCSQVSTCGLRADGTVWCWGSGKNGQMGNGTAKSSALPVQVQSPDGKDVFKDAVAVAAGHTHHLALKGDGTVWVWGLNDRGQLGNGSRVEKSPLPVQVKTPDGKGFLKDVIGIAAGVGHCVAVRKDGTVLAWGENVVGQVGDGTTTDRFLPVALEGVNNAVSVGAGWHFSLAVGRDGSLFGWGYNEFGQIGDGTVFERHRPVQAVGPDGKAPITGVSRAVGGSLHSLIIKKDGSLWSYGCNNFGQLGIGKRGGSEILPVQVKGLHGRELLTDVVDADAGSVHSAAVTKDGIVYCWGDNYRRQAAGDPAVPAVGGCVMNGEFVDRASMLGKKGVMGVAGPPWPWPAKLPSYRVVAVLGTLEKIGPESKDKVTEVAGHLADKDARVRRTAVKALGRIGSSTPGVVSGLTKALDDEDRSVRLESVRLLCTYDVGVEGVVQALTKALDDKTFKIREKALDVLRSFGPAVADQTMPTLWRIAKDKADKLSGDAFSTLGFMGEKALPGLLECFENNNNDRMRMKAAAGLGSMGPKAVKAVPALIKALEDKDKDLRKGVAQALGKIGSAAKAAIPALEKAMLNDKDKKVRRDAKKALKKIGGN